MEVTERLLPTAKAAEELQMSPYWLHKERAAGRGPRYVRIGKKVFYRPADLHDYIEQSAVETEFSRG